MAVGRIVCWPKLDYRIRRIRSPESLHFQSFSATKMATLAAPTTSAAPIKQFHQESYNSKREIEQIHALIVKNAKTSPTQRLLRAKISSLLLQDINSVPATNLSYACSLANLFDKNDAVRIFNSVIHSTSSSSVKQIMGLYSEMLLQGLFPDTSTIPSILKTCAESKAFNEGYQIHAHSIKMGFCSDVFVKNNLMRFYVVSGNIKAAEHVFDECSNRDLVSWTILVQGYAKMGYYYKAISVFFSMDLRADGRTLVVVLSACSKLGDFSLGEKICAYIDYHKIDVNSDVFLGNALVDMYLKCGQPELACQTFDKMPVRNVTSWNCMISGLAQRGRFKEALDMFRLMQNTGMKPNSFTLVSVLNSCANLGALDLGKWVHSYIDRIRIKADGYVGNALVDMYAKCGGIDQALNVFQAMKCRDVYTYTAMIYGLAMNGQEKRALYMFSEMHKLGIQPDKVTFVAILSACSHAGLVEEGQRHFEDMSRLYKLEPQREHYGCMVDLLGRAGLISQTLEFINKMPILPDPFIWGSLLKACRIHGRVELGESVMQKLVEMEAAGDGEYTLVSNIYASANRRGDALKWRKAMKNKQMKKTPGCSSIVVAGVVHEFQRGEKSHPSSKALEKLLQEMMHHLRSYGLDKDIALC